MRLFIGIGCCASIMPVGGTIAWASLNWGVAAPAAVAALSGTAKLSNRAKAPLTATSGTFITRSTLCFSDQVLHRSRKKMRAELIELMARRFLRCFFSL
jgi:hypothetical protein